MAREFAQFKAQYENEPQKWRQDKEAVYGFFNTMRKFAELGDISVDALDYCEMYPKAFGREWDGWDEFPDMSKQQKQIRDTLERIEESEEDDDLQEYLMKVEDEDGKKRTNYQIITDKLRETGGEDAVKKFDSQMLVLRDALGIDIDPEAIRAADGKEQDEAEPEDEREDEPERAGQENEQENEPENEQENQQENEQEAEPEDEQEDILHGLGEDHHEAEHNAPQEGPSQTALAWTEQYKRQLKNGTAQLDEGYPTRYFARYMAARDLSNSVRGDKSTLNKELTAGQIERRATELMENQHFQDFMKKANDEPAFLAKLEAAARKSPGHGGGIDDMFREYIVHLEPGKLDNNGAVPARYMPTALDRIDVLKARAKKAIKDGDDHVAITAAAEVVGIRNLAHAERGKKGTLKKTIPNGLGLRRMIQVQTEDNNCCQNLWSKIDYLQNGHGGEMVERLRAQLPTQSKFEEFRVSDAAKDVLTYNTLTTQRKHCRYEAKKLLEAGNLENAENLGKAKELVKRYVVMCGVSKNSEGQTKDVPWSEVDRAMSEADGTSLGKLTGEAFTPELAEELLTTMRDKSGDRFIDKVAAKLAKLEEPRKTVVQQDPQQGDGQRELQNQGGGQEL